MKGSRCVNTASYLVTPSTKLKCAANGGECLKKNKPTVIGAGLTSHTQKWERPQGPVWAVVWGATPWTMYTSRPCMALAAERGFSSVNTALAYQQLSNLFAPLANINNILTLYNT